MLDSKPRFLVSATFEHTLCMCSKVTIGRHKLLAVGVSPSIGIGQDNEMLTLSERISVVGDRLHNDFRVVSGRLVARRAVIVPLREVFKRVHCARNSSAL